MEDISPPTHLSVENWAKVHCALSSSINFVDNDIFYQQDAEKQLFNSGVDIPRPEIGWYMSCLHSKDNVPGARDINRRLIQNVLLGKNEEILLFLQFNYARYRLSKFVCNKRTLSTADGQEILKWYGLATELRNRIAQMNLAIVITLASRLCRYHQDITDMVGEGNVNLLNAIYKFDVRKGVRFSTYIWWSISRAIIRQLFNAKQHNSHFKSLQEEGSEKEVFENEYSYQLRLSIISILEKNSASLTTKEFFIIQKTFFELDNNAHKHTLSSIAEIMGISYASARSIKRSAYKKLRLKLDRIIKPE